MGQHAVTQRRLQKLRTNYVMLAQIFPANMVVGRCAPAIRAEAVGPHQDADSKIGGQLHDIHPPVGVANCGREGFSSRI